MKTVERILTALACLALLGTLWCFSVAIAPGDQWLAAIGTGVCGALTVTLIIEAARMGMKR